MKCPKCNYEAKNNMSICPRCGSSLQLRKTTKSKKALSGTKSKINIIDKSSLVGGTVSKGYIVNLRKAEKKKDISIKQYNSIADYKDAKENNNMQNSNPFEGSFFVKTKKPVNIYSRKDLFVDNNTGVSSNLEQNNNQVNNGKYFGNQLNNGQNHVLNNENTLVTFKKNNQVVNFNQVKDDIKGDGKRQNIFKFLVYGVIITLWVLILLGLYSNTRETYYFSEDEKNNEIVANTESPTIDKEMAQYDGVSKSGQVGGSSGDGVTSIVYDNQYIKQLTLKSDDDVYKLISADSLKQKTNCPSNIEKIENEIINNYGIVAVNLCEMDYEFALELRDVVKYIYNNYPKARNYLTNLTLANVEEDISFIAAFMPVFSFATSKTDSGYPVGIKTQIILNAKYFLDNSKIKNSVNYGSKSGYFPPNATRSSTVAHEFGHYLSYVALLNNYNSLQLNYVKASQAGTLYKVYEDFNEGNFSYNLLREAYEDYAKVYSGDSFEDFRSSISGYAVAKDTNGNYIYDETIAEAFHDVYLNGELAQAASRYIVKTLVSKL